MNNHIKFPKNEINHNKANVLRQIEKFNTTSQKVSFIDRCIFHWKNLMKYNKSSTLGELLVFGKALKYHLETNDLYQFYSPGLSVPAEFNIANYNI